MAIKLPDPGNGIPEQKTGNDEWTNMKIVRDNFADTSNAASRLVGKGNGNLVEMSEGSVGGFGLGGNGVAIPSVNGELRFRNYNNYTAAFYRSSGALDAPKVLGLKWGAIYIPTHHDNNGVLITASSDPRDKSLYFMQRNNDIYGEWITCYTSGNTTKDSNGFIKASSPVLRVFSDHIEGNDDGERMGAEFVKKGVGDYLIKGTTGLADEGWYVTIPQDANGNNLVAVEYESLENGDVVLRTYKRRFDFETVSIVADHDNPLDIPETRWIDLRFNDLPEEQLDEPIE